MRRNIKRARFWIGNPHLYLEPTVNDYFVVEDELTRGIAIYQRQYPGDLAPYIGEVPTAVFDHCTYYRLAKSNDFREELELEWAEFQYKVEWCHPYRALFSSDIATFTKGADSWFLSEDFTILTRDPDNIDDSNDIVINIPDLPYPKNEPDGLADITPTHILTDRAFEKYSETYLLDSELSDNELETLRNAWEAKLEEDGGNKIVLDFELGDHPELISEDKYLSSDLEILNALRPHINELVLVVQEVGTKITLPGTNTSIVDVPYDGFLCINANEELDTKEDLFLKLINSESFDSEDFFTSPIFHDYSTYYEYARFFNTLYKNKKACIYSTVDSHPTEMYFKSIPIQNVEIINFDTTKTLRVTYLANPNLLTYVFCNPVYNDKQYGLTITHFELFTELPDVNIQNVSYEYLEITTSIGLGYGHIYEISALFPQAAFVNEKKYVKELSAPSNEGIWDDSDEPGRGIKKGSDTKGIVTKVSGGTTSFLLSTISTVVNANLRFTKELPINEVVDTIAYWMLLSYNLGRPLADGDTYTQCIVTDEKLDTFGNFLSYMQVNGYQVYGITLNAYTQTLTTWQDFALYGTLFICYNDLKSDTPNIFLSFYIGLFDPVEQVQIINMYNTMYPDKPMPNITAEYNLGKQMGFKKLAAAKWINDIEIDFSDFDFTGCPLTVGDFAFPKSVLSPYHIFRLHWRGIITHRDLADNTPPIYPGNIDLTNMEDISGFKSYYGNNMVIGAINVNQVKNGYNAIYLVNMAGESENAPQWLASTFKFPKHASVLYLSDFSMHKLNIKNIVLPSHSEKPNSESLIMNSIFTDNITLPKGDYLFRLNGCITDVLDMSKTQVYKYLVTDDFDASAIAIDLFLEEGDTEDFNTRPHWYIDNLRNNVARKTVYLPSQADWIDPDDNEYWILQGILSPIRVLEDGIKELDYSNLMRNEGLYYFVPPSNYPSLKTVNFGDNNKEIRFKVPYRTGDKEISYIENIIGNFNLFPENKSIHLENMPHLSSNTIDKIISKLAPIINMSNTYGRIYFNSALESKITLAQIDALDDKKYHIVFDPYDIA